VGFPLPLGPRTVPSLSYQLFTATAQQLNPIGSLTHSLTNQKPTRSQSQNQCRSYFTTGGLPPINLSWRQGPWDTWRFSFSTEPLRTQSLRNILSDEMMGVSLMNILSLSSSERITHITYYSKIFLLHY
jgi:hypothetical protein